MEMHQIRYFLAVARTLNFTQAADECNVSQPSLSRAIIKLEEELGGDLFRRERSLTHLTDLGRMMRPLLQQTYDAAASAKSLATSYRKGGVAPLRLALSSTVDFRVLIKPLSGLIDALPGTELRFYRGAASDVLEQVKSGEFELGIAGKIDTDWERFRSHVLFSSPLRLYVCRSHRLAGRETASLADLREERLLGRPYCEVAHRFGELLAGNDIRQAPGDMIASDTDTLELVKAGVGVAIMAGGAPINEQCRSIELVDVELDCPTLLYTVIGRQHSPAAAGLIQLLRAANWRQLIAALGASRDASETDRAA